MTRTAQSADGKTHEFPDETPDEVMDNAMRQYVGGAAPPPPPEAKTKPNETRSEETFREVSNRWSQGLSRNILRGVTMGVSSLLPDPPEENIRRMDKFDEEHPAVAVGGEVGGAIATGYGAAKLLAAKAPAVSSWITQRVPSWLQAAGIGVTEGTIYGASTAEPGERTLGAVKGGGIGAAAGPVGLGVMKVGGAVSGAVSNVVKRMLNNTPRAQARRILESAIKAGDMSPEFIQAELDKLGKHGVLADVDESLARVARGAAALDQKSHSIAGQFLETRQGGQQARLLAKAGPDAFDSEKFASEYSKWMKGRITDADNLYKEAYEHSLEATDGLIELMNKPSIKGSFDRARELLVEEGVEVSDVRIFDAVKRLLDDEIGAALRAGNRNKARVLTKTKKQLLEEMDAQVPAYKEARNIFAGEAALKDAAEMGYELVGRKTDLWILEDAVAAMGESEKHVFRQGALRGLVDKLDATATNRNAAQKLIESKRALHVLKLVFPDDETFNAFVNQATNESRFAATRATVRGGSPTSRIDEDKAALQAGASVGAAVSQGGDAVTMALRLFKAMGFSDVSPETLEVVSRALFSGDGTLLQRAAARKVTVDQLSRTAAGASAGAIGGGAAIDNLSNRGQQ